MNDYLRYGHAKTRLRYRLIFSTKYRHKCLLGIERQVYAAMRVAEQASHFTIVEMAVDLGDHIHLVVEVKPSLSLEQVVRRLKQLSTWELWATESNHLKKYYWGSKKLLWTHGYFASTMGAMSDQVVLEYVKKQAK